MNLGQLEQTGTVAGVPVYQRPGETQKIVLSWQIPCNGKTHFVLRRIMELAHIGEIELILFTVEVPSCRYKPTTL